MPPKEIRSDQVLLFIRAVDPETGDWIDVILRGDDLKKFLETQTSGADGAIHTTAPHEDPKQQGRGHVSLEIGDKGQIIATVEIPEKPAAEKPAA